jgi:hypothetical protein
MSLKEKLMKNKLRKGISKLNASQKLEFLLESFYRLDANQLEQVRQHILTYPESNEKTVILNKIKELQK